MLDTISFHARRSPAKIACIDPVAGEISYSDVQRLIVALASRLLRDIPDVRQLQPVAIACADMRWHLLLTFALEALGVCTLPFVQPADPGLRASLKQCPLVIGERESLDAGQRYFVLNSAWFEAVEQEPLDANFQAAIWQADQVVTILTTSGSTGAAKCIALHRQAFDLREQNRVWQYGLTGDSRYLITMPISVSIVGMVARATLRCGGSLRFWRSGNPMLAEPPVTHSTLLPGHVQTLLASTPADFRASVQLKIFSTGAPLSRPLRDRAVARLGAEVINSYGTNETGTAIWFDANGDGEVLPGVDVEIVDRQLKPVPRGVAGLMRLRTPEMALGYLDAALSTERFVDGWFISDDIAVMSGARRVMLMGRSDTMINIGGTKVAPDEIEAVLLDKRVAADLAVCALPNADGIEELYVLVADAGMPDSQLIHAVTTAVGPNFGHVRIARVALIPRTAAGKVQRQALRELLIGRVPTKP